MSPSARILALLLLVVTAPAAAEESAEYEIGGPLAGLKLPRYVTHHGEEPGYPGCIPLLMATGTTIEDMGHTYREWGPQGQAPEWQLYDGSVEHYRAYMFKYMPIRSSFDRQSQLKNFVAPNIPGAAAADVTEYAEPVYWVPRHEAPRPTGRTNPPMPVVRMKPASPALRLDLGILPVGLYAVRVIGAVETPRIRPFREPLFMRMSIDDGPSGERSEYRMRLGYCDEFYSVAEFHFHAPAARRYQAELAVDRGSTVDLLVHNVSLDDALAGAVPRRLKERTTIAGAVPAARAAIDARRQAGQVVAEPLDKAERLRRDAMLWNRFPPLNSQGSTIRPGYGGYGAAGGVTAGTDRLDGKAIVEQFGEWRPWRKPAPPDWAADVPLEDIYLVNEKLQLVYRVADARAGRPLPDPYPVKDDGAGVYFPDPADPGRGAAWTPIGLCVADLYRETYNEVGRSLALYKSRGEEDHAHDAALALVRLAYDFPTLDTSEYLSSAVRDPGEYGRDYACRRRASEANFLPHYPMYVKPIAFWYDELYDTIKENRVLAESVGRFVPWVKTPDDVLRLIDVYLVQTTAKRIMRYHYHTDVVDIANLAAVVGNRQATDPWMEWLFARTFVYPLPVAGVQDAMISGTQREGTEVVGSTYYAQGEGAERVASSLDLYLRTGGNPKFDLSDQRRYPKPVAHARWRIENVVGGGDFLRIGDVCGPDKSPGHSLRDLDYARSGWRWTREPGFAFILRHYLGRGEESDAEWAEIERAAAAQPRAAWLELRSRVMPNWAGVLESGVEHDDYRFRRAAYLRLGFGVGHEHFDGLDLQLFAHGLPMTIDAGQRPGYSTPGDRSTYVHNLVQVDGETAHRHSWATALADCGGARYLAAEAAPPEGLSLMRRQIALVDVDEGSSSEPLPPEKQRPPVALPGGVTTPNGYVFDVFRVDGGRSHMYCFHGPINDDFAWNVAGAGPPAEGSDEAAYLARYRLMPELTSVGAAPALLEATWRMAVEVEGPGAGEKEMLGPNYAADAPRKFTRLHLFDVAGARAMRGEVVCKQWGYHFTNLMVRTPAAPRARESAFVALVEPYVGQPVITGRRTLRIEGNESDARRAAAVEVKTRNGHVDVCFADGRPDRVRTLPEVRLAVVGEFAFHSSDAAGLRQATLVGGRRLESPAVRLVPQEAERRGRVVRVDYGEKKLWIDQPWPARKTPSVFEIGVPGHMTTYTAASIAAAPGGSVFSLLRGADYFRSEVTEINADESTVTTALRPLVEYIDQNRSGWAASDEEQKNFWSAAYLGAGRFKLAGPPLSPEALGPAGVLRLWEYGVDDRLRQSTSVSLRRVEPGVYAVETDVAAALSLPGRSAETSADGKTWRPATATVESGWITLNLGPSEAPQFVRVAE